MTQYTRPDTVPAWAEAGDKVQPTNSEIQIGWPVTNVPPSRQRFNWILGWLANAARYLLQLGVPEWAADETYVAGARVQRGGVTYKAIASSTNVTPGTDAAKWEKWGFLDSEIQPRVDRLLTKSVAGGADVTLSAAEAENGILVFTGAITANINVVIPNAARRYVVHNGTSGSYSLSVKTSSGPAVAVPQSTTKSVVIYCDGANNVRLAGSANDASIQNVPFTATAGQTTFSVSYTAGAVFMVTRNGASVPFTASNGTTVVLGSAATSGDLVNVFVASGFVVSGAMNKGGDTATGPLAGPSPATGDRSNLYATMAKFADEFAVSKTANGYQKLPSGLIIQWGKIDEASHPGEYDFGAVTLPIPFPNAALFAIGQIHSSATPGNADSFTNLKALSTTQVHFYAGSNISITYTFGLYWFAVGY